MKRLCRLILIGALLYSCGTGSGSGTGTGTGTGSGSGSGSVDGSCKQESLATPDSKPHGTVVNFPIDDPSKRSYDTIQMGRIAQGDVIEGEFTIHNKANQPLVIIDVITGCGCTTTQYDPKPIAPNASRNITYRFESKTFIGQQFKSIEIITSDRSVATVYLNGQIYTQ